MRVSNILISIGTAVPTDGLHGVHHRGGHDSPLFGEGVGKVFSMATAASRYGRNLRPGETTRSSVAIPLAGLPALPALSKVEGRELEGEPGYLGTAPISPHSRLGEHRHGVSPVPPRAGQMTP
jgi:hypothetical protein